VPGPRAKMQKLTEREVEIKNKSLYYTVISCYFKVKKLRDDGAHKNWHLIRIIRIREQYGTLDARSFQS
jgi:hypothetical protein